MKTTGFRSSEIRPHMDVFTFDGVRLGSIVRVAPGPVQAREPAIQASALQRSEIDGELLGPVPTQDAGNFGPVTQSPGNRYGVAAQGGDPLGAGSMQITTVLGMFGRRWIPIDDVQTVAMERVVLRRLASHYQPF